MKSKAVYGALFFFAILLSSRERCISQGYFNSIRNGVSVCQENFEGVIVAAKRSEVRLFDPAFEASRKIRKREVYSLESIVANSEFIKSELGAMECSLLSSKYVRQYCGYIVNGGAKRALITFWYLTKEMQQNLKDEQYLVEFSHSVWGLDDGGCRFLYVIVNVDESTIERIGINGNG